MSQDNLGQSWHILEADQVLSLLGVSREGLSAAEAARRLAEYGPNHLPRAKGRSAW